MPTSLAIILGLALGTLTLTSARVCLRLTAESKRQQQSEASAGETER